MEHRTTTDPEEQLERTGDELKERLEKLDDHIDDARQEAKARREESDPGEGVAGDWEDTDDDAGGEDPEGFDDPEAEDEDEE
jgi:hypothetical protein